jgi:hypothetical protein
MPSWENGAKLRHRPIQITRSGVSLRVA